ncbi:uncharacterized protein EI90DRAFT_2119984 [Cantharellus anzutake]|uniref:uncharacterized protein n=1 Tax=Cantharellus anzutake TaxID=1750568 RepID=UPI0019039C57|nr:uncharacterized protein EI90DRAFT_2119984 [Cantharellus anzutake]KAF8325543.1 hypothetical protein EI90DRAFT_2119984 [Cantharellus anzutake]
MEGARMLSQKILWSLRMENMGASAPVPDLDRIGIGFAPDWRGLSGLGCETFQSMPMPSRSEENSMPIRSESDLSGALPLRDWLPCLERRFKRDHIPLSYLLTNTEIYPPTRARIWRGSHEVAELLDRARWKNTERRRVWSQIFRDAYQILSTNSTHLHPDIGLERS